MIRMVQSQSAQHAKSYFSQSLKQSDYYLNDQEYPGHFNGRIATRLGLPSMATKDAFFALCENRHPVTGKRLTMRNKADRRIGYDINFHCPKSVSVLHVLSKDNHILDAFHECVQDTMLEIEKDVQTRVRKGKEKNADNNRQTGELVWAEFIHQTARPVKDIEPDPHLHCHCFTFNVTWDDEEQRYKAGQFGDIKKDMPYYQARFHKKLADKLEELGYRIRRTDTSFEIEGVPQSVIDLFSKRTNEIGQIAKEQGINDPAELDKLGSRTRAKKQKGLSMLELKLAWRKQVYDLGMDKQGDGKTIIRYNTTATKSDISALDCITHATKSRFERASVCDARQLLATAFRHGLGASVSVDNITQAFNQDNDFIHVTERNRQRCSTYEVLASEKHMVALARQGIGVLSPLYQALPPINLDGQQAEAVRHILTTSDRVSIIQGRAGTGKTTLMKEAVSLIEQTGRKVVVVAPTSDASRGVLRQEGFINAETVAQLLNSTDIQDRLKDNVLWVDEAGLLGTQDMTALLDIAKEQNARVILSGDTRQHTSVVRGDALRILNVFAGIKSAYVSKIYRQRNRGYKHAVQALVDGNIGKAFEHLQEIEAIKEIEPAQAVNRVADDFVATIIKGKTALVVSPTHKQCDEVTDTIRHKLQDNGIIGKDETVIKRLVNLNMTEADRQDARNYKIGQVVQFGQNTKGFKRGSKWIVEAITGNDVIVKSDHEQQTLPLHDAKHFDVFATKEIGLSFGDSIRITRNGFDINGKRLNNGQRLIMSGMDDKGNIKLKNADSNIIYDLPNNYGHIAHGYCTTSHASQGKTVDEVFIYQPSATFVASNMKQFYVSVSRGRDMAHIYTDNSEDLRHVASEGGDRLSALELLVKRKKQKHQTENIIRQRQGFVSPKDNPLPVNPFKEVKHHAPKPSL
jgi:conjugative relaxase-like TrwC/TraI family protein